HHARVCRARARTPARAAQGELALERVGRRVPEFERATSLDCGKKLGARFFTKQLHPVDREHSPAVLALSGHTPPEHAGAFELPSLECDSRQPGNCVHGKQRVLVFEIDRETLASLPLGLNEVATTPGNVKRDGVQARLPPAPLKVRCNLATSAQEGL